MLAYVTCHPTLQPPLPQVVSPTANCLETYGGSCLVVLEKSNEVSCSLSLKPFLFVHVTLEAKNTVTIDPNWVRNLVTILLQGQAPASLLSETFSSLYYQPPYCRDSFYNCRLPFSIYFDEHFEVVVDALEDDTTAAVEIEGNPNVCQRSQGLGIV